MYVDFTPEQKALQQELRGYLNRLVDERVRAELQAGTSGGPEFRRVLRQLGKDGWLGIGWPKAYGGQDRSAIEQYIFAEEIHRTGYPFPFLTVGTVGPTIMKYGTEAQRERFLPKVLAGELLFSIGYSEPQAGTDLASLQTRAVQDGDHFIINGQKIWTSLADHTDYVWLACRTDPDAPKHRGISMILVPLDAPGVSMSPILTVGGTRTNATFYENVRVPVENCVGGVNQGWTLITNQLNHERVSLFNHSTLRLLYDDVLAWAKQAPHRLDGHVIDVPWVRAHLARFRAHLEVLQMMNWKQAWDITQGGLKPADASALKVFASEFHVQGHQWLMEVLGEAGTIRPGEPAAILQGRVEKQSRASWVLTFGAGVNEVQRDIIAMAGLGLPNYKN